MPKQTYTGLKWIVDPLGQSRLIGSSRITPLRYVADYATEDRCSLLAVFSQNELIDLESQYLPHVRLGVFPSLDAALFVAERHDFAFFKTQAEHGGAEPVFVGSDRTRAVSEAIRASGMDEDEFVPGDHICPNGRPFTRTASFFPAKKVANKQNADGSFGLQITVDAREMPVWLLEAPMGTLLMLGAVNTGHEDSDDEKTWKKRASDAFKRAHMMANESEFQEWLGTKYDHWGLIAVAMQQNSDAVVEATAETIKRIVGVPSRADLKTNRDAVERLERLDREYYKDLSYGFGIYGSATAA